MMVLDELIGMVIELKYVYRIRFVPLAGSYSRVLSS